MACVRIPFAFKVHCYYCSVAKSCPTLLWRHGLYPARLLCPWDFPGKNTRVGCHFFFQGIFQTQGSNLRLLLWQADSLPLCHQGSLRFIDWLFNFLYMFKVTLHLQSLQSTGCIPRVIPPILDPILYPMLCTSHSPTLILPLPPPYLLAGNHFFVLCICEFASFCCIH